MKTSKLHMGKPIVRTRYQTRDSHAVRHVSNSRPADQMWLSGDLSYNKVHAPEFLNVINVKFYLLLRANKQYL